MSCPSDLQVTNNDSAGQSVEFEHATLALGPRYPGTEHPFRSTGGEVFLLLPGARLIGMAAGNPTPNFVTHIIIQFRKGPLGCSIAMVVGPTPQERVELAQERLLCEAQGGLNQLTDFEPQAFDFVLCRLNQQFIPLFAHSVPQKVKALIDGGEDGLLL